MFLPPGHTSSPVGHSFDVNQSRRQMRALAIKQHPFCTVTEEAESPERLISSVSAKMTGVMDVNEHNGRRPKFFPEIIRRLSRFLTPKSVKRKQRMPRNGSSHK